KISYLAPESRTQLMVRRTVSDFCEYPIEKMPIGIDGCSAPNFPLALRNIAVGFMKLANVRSDDLILRPALNRIRGAMWEFPEMVSGEGRFDLALMRSFPNNVICKIGAEALEGIGFSDPPVGIAVKIHDGNERALGAVCVSILKQLDIIGNIDDFPHLKPYENPEVHNVREIITGHIISEFKLRGI
ncbi:MAG: asparaginase, partial [candidate division Zixibacteria bacterium]|nr:asparaginase [candidate division Zixibacteria bacterium]